MQRRWTAVICCWVSGMGAAANAEPFRSYHVGNSLTWNLLYSGRLTSLSAGTNRLHTAGWHTRSSAPLSYIWANPSDVAGASPTTFNTALPNNHWNAVTFQPYVTSFSPIASTLATDRQVISNMTALLRQNATNATTSLFIYAAWPNVLKSSPAMLQYEEMWLREIGSDASEPTSMSRAYFEALYEDVRLDNPNIRMIPAGEALYAVDQRIRLNELPGLTNITQLYGDDYHLNDLGSHVIAAAAYATVFGESPVGLPYNGIDASVPADTLREIQATVWTVVTSHSYTGVPEPASLSVIGLAGYLLLRRRCSELTPCCWTTRTLPRKARRVTPPGNSAA